MMMPPARAMAPPLRPVPAPRPTIGTPCSPADLDDRDHIFGGARKDDQIRPRLIDAAIVFVEGQIFRAVEIAARAEQLRQLLFGLGRKHDQSSDLT